MATSDKRQQSLAVGCAREPHQALEAYVSLEIITDRYMVCNGESSIPCARNTRMCSQKVEVANIPSHSFVDISRVGTVQRHVVCASC